MQITTQTGDKATTVELTGRFDASAVPQFRDFISQLLQEETNHFVLNMKGVTYIDSGGLGSLVSFLRQVRLAEGDIKIAALDDRVRSVFELTRLHRIFEIYDDSSIALQSFN